MTSTALKQVFHRPVDLFFVALLIGCILFAVFGVTATLQKREALLVPGGPRKVDLTKIRKQMSEGTLSGHKARFFKKVRP